MPFPLVKIAYLAIRQVSKPLANVLKRNAKTNEFVRKHVLMRSGQLYHAFETRLQARLHTRSKKTQVFPLKEESAVELGAEILGEGIIFSVASLTIFYEYSRQKRNEANTERKQDNKLTELGKSVQEMGLRLEEQSAQIRNLTRVYLAQNTVTDTIVDSKSGVTLKVKKS